MNAFSCVLMGSESLLIRCAEQLRQRGHTLQAVVTDDAQIRRWAQEHGLDCLDAEGDYAQALGGRAFDYFFSIANLRVVPERVLARAQQAAINFHDGPLPEYAGLNVTSWAILNQEPKHAVTWHLMERTVDAGAVLKRQAVPIEAGETTLSLNAKCYQAALESFGVLIDELARGAAQPVAQPADGDGRYFGRLDRPAQAGTLRWTQPAAALSALARALDFGAYKNPLGVPTLWTGRAALLAPSLTVQDESSSDTPGTILRVEEDRVTVATATQDVTLAGLRSPDGQVLAASDLEAYGLRTGTVLPALTGAQADALETLHRSVCRDEAFWAKRLAARTPMDVPYARLHAARADHAKSSRSEHVIPEARALAERLRAAKRAVGSGEALAAAFGAYLSMLSGRADGTLGFGAADVDERFGAAAGFFASPVPLAVQVEAKQPAAQALGALADEVRAVRTRGGYLRDLPYRTPALRTEAAEHGAPAYDVVVRLEEDLSAAFDLPGGAHLAVRIAAQEDGAAACQWIYGAAYDDADIQRMQQQFRRFVEQAAAPDDTPLQAISLIAPEERAQMLGDWNDTARSVPEVCVHTLIEQQARRTPQGTAASFKGSALTYEALDARANRVAHYLRAQGIARGSRVGIHVERSLDLLAGMLGILKAGAAYVPLDPNYPDERLAFIAEDAALDALLTRAPLPGTRLAASCPVVSLEADAAAIDGQPATAVESGVQPSDLAYVIYTSGSTGRPKGVMLEHRNVANFFAGMDEPVAHERPNGTAAGVWLALTSVSFDISVLELFWTLARGFTVILQPDERREAQAAALPHAGTPIDFSLFYFSSDESEGTGREKYRLLLEGATFGDENGFEAVWTPERHFHAFGGLFPNPSVMSAALATATERIGLRAGSCVAPLHSPVRIAEEWAVVDSLSDGRVGISFAAGWQPNDFVLAPENYADRKARMFEHIAQVQALWRGERVAFPNADGQDVPVRTLPRPVQKELPVWVTAAGNPETFRMAGAGGFNLLTHLLGQSVDELAGKIAIYRQARREAGHAGKGCVTLMLHTFVGEDAESVRETVRGPMKAYLRSSIGLIKDAAWSFPTFKKKTTDADGRFSVDHLSDEDLDAVLDYSFERYYETSALFGTPETCAAMVDRLKGAGISEIACLIDFGVDPDAALEHLPALNAVRQQANAQAGTADEDWSVAAQLRRHGVTHVQCTPSQARMLLADADTRAALAGVQQFMVGGEACPPALADRLCDAVGGRVTNMYGPTETTIWSTTHALEKGERPVPIGRPIANTQVYVLNGAMQPMPVGVPGDLYLGGQGVARGYWHRAALTAERFVPDPFADDPDARLYRTGDRSRYRADGVLEFLGRDDHQVKIRGHRIELGEVEAVLAAHEDVRVCAAVAREDAPGDQRLVAYVVPAEGAEVSVEALHAQAARTLPAPMRPSDIVVLHQLPLTPNGKIDRAALPKPERRRAEAAAPTTAPPASDAEQTVAAIWQQALDVDAVGASDNFFDLGGHSLLAVQVAERLRAQFDRAIAIVDLFRYPTVRALAAYLAEDGGGEDAAAAKGEDRAQKRREALLNRRRQRSAR